MCRPENPHEHLVEAVQVWPDGRQKKRGRLLSETLRPTEEPVEGALRGLCEELGSIATAANIEIEEASLTTWRERVDSPSYPTLPSEYTLYQVSARVHGLFWLFLPGFALLVGKSNGFYSDCLRECFALSSAP